MDNMWGLSLICKMILRHQLAKDKPWIQIEENIHRNVYFDRAM